MPPICTPVLQAGTERAFTGKTVDGSPHDNKSKGVYVSAVGGLPLFSSGNSS
jgi:peptide methionine sulfoxide reductase MsrB